MFWSAVEMLLGNPRNSDAAAGLLKVAVLPAGAETIDHRYALLAAAGRQLLLVTCVDGSGNVNAVAWN